MNKEIPKRRHLVTTDEKKQMSKLTITGNDMSVEHNVPLGTDNHLPVKEVKPDEKSVGDDSIPELTKEKTELTKTIIFCVTLIIVLLISAFILAIIFRPDGIKPTGDLLTIIIPISVTSYFTFVTGIAVGRRSKRNDSN